MRKYAAWKVQRDAWEGFRACRDHVPAVRGARGGALARPSPRHTPSCCWEERPSSPLKDPQGRALRSRVRSRRGAGMARGVGRGRTVVRWGGVR